MANGLVQEFILCVVAIASLLMLNLGPWDRLLPDSVKASPTSAPCALDHLDRIASPLGTAFAVTVSILLTVVF
jgi:hypothetical protein